MRTNTTQIRKFKTGRPKSPTLNTNRKKFSSNLSTNYAMMLQLYCLTKKQAATKKELKCGKFISGSITRTPSKPFISILPLIAQFFTENFSFLKKARPGIAIVTE